MAPTFMLLGAGLALVYLFQIAAGRPAEGHPLRSAAKTAATLALVAAGWAAGAPGLIVIGLAFGAAGDFCLSRRGQAMFLAGVAAFAFGHIAYAVHFLALLPPLGDLGPLGQLYPVLALVALWLSTEGWLIPRTKTLRWPVRGYVAVIFTMGILATLIPARLAPEGVAHIRLGVALFILSDTLLALRLFVVRKPAFQQALSLALWPAYWIGQALIVEGSSIYRAANWFSVSP